MPTPNPGNETTETFSSRYAQDSAEKKNEVSVVLNEGMHFTAYTPEGSFDLDADQRVGGQGKGVRPIKLVLVSLAGCSAMDVVSIMRKKRQHVTDMTVRVNAEQHVADWPHVYTEAEIHYTVTGRGIDPEALRRAIELSETKYCPVIAMLRKQMPIVSTFEIIEAEPATEAR